MARQRLGQHFLADAGWREKIAQEIHVSPHGIQLAKSADEQEHCWIEIGAGHGEMTEHLLQSAAPVYAVEVDPLLIEGLKRLARKKPNLSVVPGDVLETDLRAVAKGRRIRVYGNLPYYITSPILHHFFTIADQIDEIHIVIQLEVALRLVAQPGSKDYGYISVATQFFTRPELVLRLPRDAFRPPPDVDSALVTMRLPGKGAALGLEETDKFLEFVKGCFSQKRKTLPNNLRGVADPGRVRSLLRLLQLREDARAEQLSVADFVSVFRAISSQPPPADQDNRT